MAETVAAADDPEISRRIADTANRAGLGQDPKILPSEYLDGNGKVRHYIDVANDVDTSGNKLNRFGPLQGILTNAGVKDTDLTRYLSQATGAEIHQDPSIHPPGINPSDATKGIMLGTLSPNGNDEWTQ
ncbi:hypothetical protein GFY24_18920 [Nocardia sp. SYP-A9097]|uniref:hypothetical protein n=1 Tax=Nocardia sp. SYP-A9097 TaxID=2663237 RepID=UPI00129B569D|nr:hypothetical protein [Nocardia sp. SYP-A9097]MRH89493.1 hypothetical protein [Nocardia sp. SYP-A9097]